MLEQKLYLNVFENKRGVKGFFSMKNGASERSPYYHEAVLKDLKLQDMQLIWPQQVHKDHIEIITERGDQPLKLPETDGLITNVPGVLLTTVHADCLPVYFYDPIQQAIGLVHAGWRGTAAGIAGKAAQAMINTYGSDPQDIQAYIGPGISKCCFETGSEVYEQFKDAWQFADEFAEPRGKKYYIDLKGLNQRQLKEIGVVHIEINAHCTCCEPDLFCSYRREGGTNLRMGAGICILPIEV